MEINGRVHLFFEQSGTFKNEFKKLGYEAYDYDIQNNFGETDFDNDLFKEIDDAYDGKPSLFDRITPDDLIMAFYPCIYFCAGSQMCFYLSCPNYKNLSSKETIKQILERTEQRKRYYSTLIKFCAVCIERNIKMIFENPWSEQTYLKANFIKVPDLVDNNRMNRGDYFIKPTAYWYFNCEPTYGESYQNDKEKKTHDTTRSSKVPGICSEERSMISPDYARNFICDFIIGKKQQIGQMSLF
ncbi:MAG: hypothetical protein J6S85_03735 [Methanobrevibacter sp.]|nr:hypothetical protein [Methanobrevibacter sp.]